MHKEERIMLRAMSLRAWLAVAALLLVLGATGCAASSPAEMAPVPAEMADVRQEYAMEAASRAANMPSSHRPLT